MSEKISTYSEKVMDLLHQYGLRLLGALVALIIGLWIIRSLTKGFKKFLSARNVDDSLRPFLGNIFDVLLKIALFLAIVGTLGVQMASFIAILASAGLAIGIALSGTLQNFAGGIVILLLKPFRAGDFIETQGYLGTVSEIQIFHTILKTPDNITVVIPNGGMSNTSIKNYSAEDTRRIEWVFGIAYGDDVEKAYGILKELIAKDQRINKDPEPFMAVKELANSSVNITVRVWTNLDNFWPAYWDMHKSVYDAFNANGINIPFPQMDVHLHKNN